MKIRTRWKLFFGVLCFVALPLSANADPEPDLEHVLARLAYEVRSSGKEALFPFQDKPTDRPNARELFWDEHKNDLIVSNELLKEMHIGYGVRPELYEMRVVDKDKVEHGVIIEPFMDGTEPSLMDEASLLAQGHRDIDKSARGNRVYLIQKDNDCFYVLPVNRDGTGSASGAISLDPRHYGGSPISHAYDEASTARLNKELAFWKERDIKRSSDHK
ncbi:MAG TPA: hypothetical protein VFE46_02070 [Pirellulales bacterium]|jgi:hypothetical protein|nr:hypothetical protein [Pirellulales bacterium]